MAHTNGKAVPNGDCECCTDSINVPLQLINGMLMCADCMARQQTAVKASNIVITESRKVDDSITLSKDVINASTVAFVELKAAIDNNPEIPADQKQYRLVEECALRIQKMNAAIFSHDEMGVTMKNERHAWLKNTQEFAAKLKADQREKFKQYDLNYNPAAPSKKVKSTKSAGPSKRTFDKAALYAASKKYGVPAAQVQSIVVSRGLPVEAAARQLAELMGLPVNK